MKFPGILRFSIWKVLAVVLMTAGLVGIVQRFAMGLGATTNLYDTFPWGLWIGFDVLVGVGLAAGGFIIAATVYLLNMERFRPILRPTILTAFLGYILVIAGLMVDLGRPWAIWHAIIMWNPRSVMFEVAGCVMLYTTVLALEFSPVVLEKFRLHTTLKIIRAITIPLVVVGVILSTLHQSSLGSLFLIIPGRMHPLWDSNILPFLFIISCVAAGLAMTIFESRSGQLTGRQQRRLDRENVESQLGWLEEYRAELNVWSVLCEIGQTSCTMVRTCGYSQSRPRSCGHRWGRVRRLPRKN